MKNRFFIIRINPDITIDEKFLNSLNQMLSKPSYNYLYYYDDTEYKLFYFDEKLNEHLIYQKYANKSFKVSGTRFKIVNEILNNTTDNLNNNKENIIQEIRNIMDKHEINVDLIIDKNEKNIINRLYEKFKNKHENIEEFIRNSIFYILTIDEEDSNDVYYSNHTFKINYMSEITYNEFVGYSENVNYIESYFEYLFENYDDAQKYHDILCAIERKFSINNVQRISKIIHWTNKKIEQSRNEDFFGISSKSHYSSSNLHYSSQSSLFQDENFVNKSVISGNILLKSIDFDYLEYWQFIKILNSKRNEVKINSKIKNEIIKNKLKLFVDFDNINKYIKENLGINYLKSKSISLIKYLTTSTNKKIKDEIENELNLYRNIDIVFSPFKNICDDEEDEKLFEITGEYYILKSKEILQITGFELSDESLNIPLLLLSDYLIKNGKNNKTLLFINNKNKSIIRSILEFIIRNILNKKLRIYIVWYSDFVNEFKMVDEDLEFLYTCYNPTLSDIYDSRTYLEFISFYMKIDTIITDIILSSDDIKNKSLNIKIIPILIYYKDYYMIEIFHLYKKLWKKVKW